MAQKKAVALSNPLVKAFGPRGYDYARPSFTPGSDFTAEEIAEGKRLMATGKTIDEVIQVLRPSPYPIPVPPPGTVPKKWQGKVSDLGEEILDAHRRELATGTMTEHALLRRELPHYCKPDGKPFSMDSMRHLLLARKNKRRGTPRN
jgi:hypothetical protein